MENRVGKMPRIENGGLRIASEVLTILHHLSSILGFFAAERVLGAQRRKWALFDQPASGRGIVEDAP
jgi:hypothetical protein